jgi:hypothetical protein
MAPKALATQHLPLLDNLHRRIEKEPVGVVLAITPWNYPLLTTVNTVVPAVLAGNSVIIKMSPKTPLTAGSAFVRPFLKAGAAEGLVSAVDTANDVTAQVRSWGAVPPHGHPRSAHRAAAFRHCALRVASKPGVAVHTLCRLCDPSCRSLQTPGWGLCPSPAPCPAAATCTRPWPPAGSLTPRWSWAAYVCACCPAAWACVGLCGPGESGRCARPCHAPA